jgi:hypothetical protein
MLPPQDKIDDGPGATGEEVQVPVASENMISEGLESLVDLLQHEESNQHMNL